MARSPKQPEPRPANLTTEQIGRAITLLRRRIDDLEAFAPFDLNTQYSPELSALNTKLENTLSRIYSPDTFEHQRLQSTFQVSQGSLNVNGTPKARWAPQQDENRRSAIEEIKAIISGLEEQLEFAGISTPANAPTAATPPQGDDRVFIVHGRDEVPKTTILRVVEKLGLKGIVLHEQPNRGATIIEKLERNSQCDFAIVLLTPDDEGRAVGDDELVRRARQNVILELGYFLAALGRERVCVLYVDGVEIPSDFTGVAYVKLDAGGAWRFTVASEMKAAGMKVDLNLLAGL